jgi:DNA adenine methylase
MYRFYSPLRYPGGKNGIFPFVSDVLIENGLIGVNYAEPYAGGAGLALRLLIDGYVEKIYINDFDKSIFTFWDVILNRSVLFCDWLADVKVTVEMWRHYKSIQSDSDASALELAKSTFFLNRTNVSGVIKGGVIGGYEQQGKYKIDARFNRDDLIEKIVRISRFRHRIVASNNDGIAFLQKLEKKAEEIFIYLDPPYVQKGGDLYMNFYKEKDHERLCKSVEKLNKKWMVSYDNHDFILKLYSEMPKVRYKLSQSASNRIGDEILIFSEKLDYVESMPRLNQAVSLV